MAKAAKTLDQILADVNKSSLSDIMSIGYKAPSHSGKLIPFTIPEMNRITYGGIPLGKVVEFFGKEGGGKTTTALDLIAQAQKLFPDKRVAYIDIEMTFDEDWASKMGVDCEELVMVTPMEQSAGEILNITLDLMETGEFSLIVLDSIAAMVSDAEQDKGVDEKTYAGVAGELTRFVKKATRLCAKHTCTFIGINQQRDEMNAQYVANRTPGGRAWKYLCSIRIEFRQDGLFKEDGTDATQSCENPAGTYIKAKIVKTKCFPGNRPIGTYTLNFLHGLDIVSDTIESAVLLGVIRKAGAWYYFEPEGVEVAKWNGRVKAIDALKSDDELFEQLSTIVNQLLIAA